MNEHAINMLKVESTYLSGVETKLETAKGKVLQGSVWKTARQDDSDRLRAVMATHRVYDREKLAELPHNRRIAMHGYRRTWWFGKRRTGIVWASVLCPLDALVAKGASAPPPIDLPELQDHVRKLVVDPSVEHVIGVCAPSGFTPAARAAKLELPNVTLVTIEPAPGGGWTVASSREEVPEHVLAMFDPEEATDKLDRVRDELERRSADLLTSGLSLSSVSSKLALPKETVAKAIRELAAADPELHVTGKAEDLLLFRGAAVGRAEKPSMNVVDRIRQLFSKEGDEAEKINLLAERRAKLAQRRDSLYGDIAKLEAKETDLLEQGRQNKSQITRRRLAAQLGQLRKDIGRQNTTANMLNQQINIISTDIHNLTLIQQGNMAQLPSSEELTENAVQAEEMLETLQVDAELVGNLEAGLSAVSTSEEELAILKEFEEADAVKTKTDEPRIVRAESAAEPPVAPAEPIETAEPKREADPEAS